MRAPHRAGQTNAGRARSRRGARGPSKIKTSLALLDPSEASSKRASEIEALQERLGAFEKASRDRVNVESLQQENEHQARRLLASWDGRPTSD